MFFCVAAWIYFGGGSELVTSLLGQTTTIEVDQGRRVLLMAFGAILFARMTFTLLVILKRRFGWDEFWGVVTALFTYQIAFAILAVSTQSALGAGDVVAAAVFLWGSYLNTASEVQRKRFKDRPENQGQLFTQGLFRYARHINYFGDTLWVGSWAYVTHNLWAAIIPVVLACGFIFAFIPSLTTHLRTNYADQFAAWEKDTKAFIPFIY